MSFSDNERIIKGLAFEKAVIKVLMQDNPEILADYPYTIPYHENLDNSNYNNMFGFGRENGKFSS